MRWLRRWWWWTLDYGFAARWQLRSALSRTDPRHFLSGSGRPVVVLPGVWERWQFMLPLIRSLHRAGHPVHVVTVLGGNRWPVDAAAALVSDYLRASDLRDVVLVAHSKGGLIGKRVMMTDDEARVSAMVAVNTPFSGSRYARYLPFRSVRVFSPRDATIAALAAYSGVNARITSVFPRFDPHIPEGSHLVGGTNIVVDTGGHFRVLAFPPTVDAVLHAAGAAAAPS